MTSEEIIGICQEILKLNDRVISLLEFHRTLIAGNAATDSAQQEICFEKGLSEVQEIVKKTKPRRPATDIISFFEKQGFEVEELLPNLEKGEEYLDYLAWMIGENHEIMSVFLEAIMQKGKDGKAFDLDLSPLENNERRVIIKICQEFHKVLILNLFVVRFQEGNLTIRVSKGEAANKFFTGGWCERYVRCKLSVQAKSIDPNFACVSNINLKRNGKIFGELDVVLYVNNSLFWIEVKSGNYKNDNRLDRYVEIACELGFNLSNLIVVFARLPNYLSETISSIYGCQVVNLGGLEGVLPNS